MTTVAMLMMVMMTTTMATTSTMAMMAMMVVAPVEARLTERDVIGRISGRDKHHEDHVGQR